MSASAFDIDDRDGVLKLIDWFDITRVRSAKVLVVGAGAIGNEVLKNLALLGVGNIFIFDRDTIELANLSRSVLYRESDRGHSKAATAARAVKMINPTVNVFWHHGDILSDLGEGFIRRMDVVIGCLDSLDARYLLNKRCWKAGRPWIEAGIGTLTGDVRVFEPPDGPCYECSFTEAHYRQLTIGKPCHALAQAYESQGRVPTTPTIASLVAAVQVQECLKLLDSERWRGRTLSGRQFSFDGTNREVDILGLVAREDCPGHMETAPDEVIELIEMTADHSARELLAHAQQHLGKSAHLYMGSEIALERKCRNCGTPLPLFRFIQKVFKEDLICDQCGCECKWESDITTTHIIRSQSAERLLDAKLLELGVPRMGIVQGRGPAGTSVYLELTGDQASAVESDLQLTGEYT